MRKKRFLLPAALLLLAGGFLLYLKWREAPDYTGELAGLLPARTSAFVALEDLRGLAADAARTGLYLRLTADEEFVALLLRAEKIQDLKEDVEKIPAALRGKLLFEFIQRYFGSQTVAALARFEGIRRPGLLVLTRTGLGFGERVAELCAELYPELELVTEQYQGVKIYIYKKEKSKRSFSWCRFGRTVALSLRSDSPEYLRRVIDLRQTGGPDALETHPPFMQAFGQAARRRGLTAYLAPRELLEDLHLFAGDEDLGERLQRPFYRELQALLRHARVANLSLALENQLQLRLELHQPEIELPAAGPPAAADARELLRLLPAAALVNLWGRGDFMQDAIGLLLRLIRTGLEDSREQERRELAELRPEKRRRKEQRLREEAGREEALLRGLGAPDLYRSLAAAAQNPIGFSIEAPASALLPLPRLTAFGRLAPDGLQRLQNDVFAATNGSVAELNRPPAAAQSAGRQWQIFAWRGQPLLLPLYVTVIDNRLFVATDALAPRRLSALTDKERAFSGAGNAVGAALPAGGAAQGGSPLAARINWRTLAGLLELLHQSPLKNDPDDAQWLAENQLWLLLLAELQPALLRVALPDPHRLALELALPLN